MNRIKRVIWMSVGAMAGCGIADFLGGDWAHRTLLGILLALVIGFILDDH